MNKFTFLLFSIILFILPGCGDDSSDCTADDFVGTWTGNLSCPMSGASALDLRLTKVDEDTVELFTDGESQGTIDINKV